MTAKSWRRPLLLLAASAVLLLAACSDKDEEPEATPEPSPTATQANGGNSKASPTKVATTVKATPTKAAETATKPAGGSKTPTADGTIDALGPGGTSPVTVKANPSNFNGQALLADVRTGGQNLGDRVVFEFQGTALPPAKVEYVDSATQCGSGQPVQVKGGAILLVSFTQAAAHDDQGKATFDAQKIAGPGQTVTEVVRTCDFEGHVSWAIGVTGKKNFKVTTLQNPTRLVVDVLK